MKIICKCGQKYEIDEKDREYFLKRFICINCNRKLFEVFLNEISKDLFNRPVNSDVSMSSKQSGTVSNYNHISNSNKVYSIIDRRYVNKTDIVNKPVNNGSLLADWWDVGATIVGMLNILIGIIITIILIGNNRGFEAVISFCTFTYAGVLTILIGKTVACFIKK